MNTLTLAISAEAVVTATHAVAQVAHAQTPQWTYNKRIAAAYRAETQARAEADRRWNAVRREIVG